MNDDEDRLESQGVKLYRSTYRAIRGVTENVSAMIDATMRDRLGLSKKEHSPRGRVPGAKMTTEPPAGRADEAPPPRPTEEPGAGPLPPAEDCLPRARCYLCRCELGADVPTAGLFYCAKCQP